MGRWARQGPRCSPTEFGRYFDILVRSPGTQREPKGSLGLLRRPQSGAAGVAMLTLGFSEVESAGAGGGTART